MTGPLYRRDSSGDVHWYVFDGLGSVVGELDEKGAPATCFTSNTYDVFGAARGTKTGNSKHAFVGGLGHTTEPETGGLIYMRARYYDPAVGRFISEDPVCEGSNWFVYCASNPVNRGDTSGKASEWINSVLSGPDWFIEGLLDAACEGKDALADIMDENFAKAMNISRGTAATVGGSIQLRMFINSLRLASLVADEDEIGTGAFESVEEVGTLIADSSVVEVADMESGVTIATLTGSMGGGSL